MQSVDDKVFIHDLSVHGIIGVLDWERQNPQEMLINITMYVDLHSAGLSDDLADSVSYATVADKVRQRAETAARQTVEALATDLAKLCLAEPGVNRVRVRLEKPGAVPYTCSVGVEIERTAQDFI